MYTHTTWFNRVYSKKNINKGRSMWDKSDQNPKKVFKGKATFNKRSDNQNI